MNDKYKDYDPPEYKGSGIEYTVKILTQQIEWLKTIDKEKNKYKILELTNSISFLKEYR